MSKPEEHEPLTGSWSERPGQRHQVVALSITAVLMLLTAIACLPPLIPMWHVLYFSSPEADQRGWTWLGVNSFWLALILAWMVLHAHNGPAMTAGCMVSAIIYAFIMVTTVTHWAKRSPSWLNLGDFLTHAVLLFLCVWAAMKGLQHFHSPTRLNDSSAQRREFRKYALLWASFQLFLAFLGCWPLALPGSPPPFHREAVPWEFNAAILFGMTLLVLWTAFLARGGLVDETKQIVCGWCALVFTASFILSSFDWPWLGLVGSNAMTSVVLAIDVCILTLAARS